MPLHSMGGIGGVLFVDVQACETGRTDLLKKGGALQGPDGIASSPGIVMDVGEHNAFTRNSKGIA